MVIITQHAKKRMKERCGYNKKQCKTIAYKAYHKGKTHKELKGELHKWVDGLYLSKKNANNIRIYKKHAYLFKNNVLLTVITIPKEYIGKEQKNGNSLFKNRQ